MTVKVHYEEGFTTIPAVKVSAGYIISAIISTSKGESRIGSLLSEEEFIAFENLWGKNPIK